MISYWEKESYFNYDFIVIGGGITGLSTASELKKLNPKSSVLLLERGVFPSGASTKNAGFACFGSPSEILSDIKLYGIDRTIELVNQRWLGLQKLRQKLGDEAIGFEETGGFELLFDKQIHVLDNIEYLNTLLKPIFGTDIYSVQNELIEDFGFNENQTKAIVKTKFEGLIDTGKMMRALTRYTQELGVEILTGAEVKSINEGENPSIELWLPLMNESVILKASKIALCSNGFASQLAPELKVEPGRGQVIVTKPIQGLKFKGTFHFDEGFFYFRNLGENRILLGGGRNLLKKEEATFDFNENSRITMVLESFLKSLILPDSQSYEIEMKWTGIMGFGEDKNPIVKEIRKNVFAGVKLSGMGIALGSLIGEDLANIISK